MRIAHINMFFLPTFGGVEQVMYELAKRQVADGHEVHVFCCDSDKNQIIEKKEEVTEGIHIHRFSYWFRLSLSTFIWPSLLWKFGRFGKFDIVHSHVSGHAYILFAGILSKFKKFKYIHTTHCPWTDSSFRPWVLRPFLFFNDLFMNKFSFRFIDKIIAITPWELEILNKYAEKKKRKDIAFIWVGPDEGKAEEVKTLIKPYKNMKYLGPIKGKEKIAEMFQASDIYVMPSYREGLPLTLFEAMASGLPIVASPVNGIPYEMEKGKNGFFSGYGDLKNLEKNILKLIDNKKLAKKISENNRKKSRDYNWDDIYQKYM